MPTLSLYRHGATMGKGNPSAVPPVRTEVVGWSAHAIRRNLLFLYSVDERRLEGLSGLALTLTVRECPPSPKDWQRARDAFLACLRRSGVVLVHWVTEWQRRGVPHLHLAAYWSPDRPSVPRDLVAAWLRISAPYGPRARGQHSHAIYDVLGWNQYVSKHAARGLHHYQRHPENVPQAWQGRSTGRMWGKLGDWPLVEPDRFELDQAGFWRFRRVVRSWRRADARRSIQVRGMPPGVLVVDSRRMRSARRMLRCPVERLSAVRGISEWMPSSLASRVLRWVSDSGASVLSV
jgi:hypothetical protein